MIIAGTKPFALALFAPVTERSGSRPRIAPEPATAVTLCADSIDVLVVEYDPRWLPALTLLRQKHPGLRVVAALPLGQEAAALSLGPLSIDSVPWNGQAGSVMPAIERAIGISRAAATTSPGVAALKPTAPRPAAPAAGPPARAVTSPGVSIPASPGPAAEPALDLFRDLGATVATPVPASLAPAPAMAAVARPASAAWPASGPSAGEAEQLLRGVLAGATELSPLRAVAEQTAAGLSELERAVFSGGTLEVDAELIRRAAVLRLRVAAALASRPPPGTAIDGAAVAEFLSEIDVLLGAVKGLLNDASPSAKASLELIRNALVKEAVDFSEASHEIGAFEAPAGVASPAATRPTGKTRVVNVRVGEDEAEVAVRRRGWVAWLVLALAALGAGGFHGFRWWQKEQSVAEMKTISGQPEGMMLIPGPPGSVRNLVPITGPIDRTQIEKFKARQQQLGYVVTETPGGGLSVAKEPPPARDEDKRTP